MTNILQDVAAGYYNRIVQLTYRSKGPFTRGLFNGIITIVLHLTIMGCSNCDNVSLDDYENAMFAHLITQRDNKWYVRTDSGIIKEFKSHTLAKEFIFMGGVQDGTGKGN